MKRIVAVAIFVLVLSGCATPADSTPTAPPVDQKPAEQQAVVDDAGSEQPTDDEFMRGHFSAVFLDFDVSIENKGSNKEVHLVADIPENAVVNNWDEVCDALVTMLNEYSDQKNLVCMVESTDGRILATAFNGKLQYNAYSEEERYKSLDMILAEATVGERNAYYKAIGYLENMPFSYSGLVEQLEFNKFTHKEAVFAADNCGADWYEQAAKKAKSYLSHMAFSRDGLIDQLVFNGFSQAEAEYGVTQCGY